MRVIFNTSFIVNENAESEFVHFMKNSCIVFFKEKEMCQDIIFTKVSIDQPDGKTYSLQLVFRTLDELNSFVEHHFSAMQEKLFDQFGNKYFFFSSNLVEL